MAMTDKRLNFNFSEEYILEDNFIKIIPLEEKHIDPLFEISNDPFIWTYFFDKGDTYQKLTNYIRLALENRKKQKENPFAIFDKRKNRFTGTTRFYEYSAELKTIKLGHTWFGKEFRGTGLNKHCKFLLFDFAFDKLALERIGFGVHAENIISIAALQSVGCKKEGVLRNMFPSLDGKGRADTILMSILRQEWHTKESAELLKKLKA